MKTYTKGQRWISEMEPELGLGTVLEVQSNRVQILFPASGEMRMYAAENAPLKRVRFREGNTLTTFDQQTLVVTTVVESEGLITYRGDGIEVPEALLSDMLSFTGAEDRLLSGNIDDLADFQVRRRTLFYHHLRSKSPVRGFVGGRINLIPHQLYIGHEVSSRYAPRVLLADEVGLGKTIEACLIIHRMLLSGRAGRVLILVPESLVHQWFVELLRRFNLWFHIFDEARCEALEADDPTVNPFFDDQLILSDIGFIATSEKRTLQVLDAEWDVLVVDEAHHLEWSTETVSPSYALIEKLSHSVGGLLLLTATPEQLGPESHFARLRLLDPERYRDIDAFKSASLAYRDIADIVENLSAGRELTQHEIDYLKLHLSHDDDLNEKLQSIARGDRQAQKQLIEDLLDLHGPGRVQFRNTRAAMRGFPRRLVHFLPLEPEVKHDVWMDRITNEFAADAGDTTCRISYNFANDPRVKGLITLLQKLNSEKVLLICSSKQKATAIGEALRQRINIKAGVFHEDLTLVQRDRNAAWFAEEDGARLLICSEIGSEGRNFQFAHHLVLFDLPLNPELLAQRIGRLDRIGQTEDIHIHVPYVPGSPQEVVSRWYHEGLNAFESSQEGGHELLRLFGRRVYDLAIAYPKLDASKRKASLELLLKETVQTRMMLSKKLEQGRDRLLERNSFRPEVAHQLVESIQAEDQNRGLETYMLALFGYFGVQIEDVAPRTYRLKGQPETREAFPAVSDESMVVTFDRKRALTREDIGFITWDHPMVTRVMDVVIGSDKGNCSFGILPESHQRVMLVETLFVLETVAETYLHVDRFLPTTPLRIVVNHESEDVTHQYPIEFMERMLKSGKPDSWLNRLHLTRELIPELIETATRLAEAEAKSIIEERLQQMNQMLDHEIHRLKTLQNTHGHIRDQEIELAVQQKEKLDEAIHHARVRLDSILISS